MILKAAPSFALPPSDWYRSEVKLVTEFSLRNKLALILNI